MSDGVNLDAVSRVLTVLLGEAGQPVHLLDPSTGELLPVSLAAATAADGLLPAFLLAGEAVWREATGNGLAFDIARDAGALLGYRVQAIGGGSFAAVMLSIIEAMAQIAKPDHLLVNDFGEVWTAPKLMRPESAGQAASGGDVPP